MEQKKIILASGSPRRRELLAEMGVDFEVVTADVEELNPVWHLAPAELATANARLKAEAVAKARPGRWVLGADTVVAQERGVHRIRHNRNTGEKTESRTTEHRIMGKPASLDEAREFLRTLSGHAHEVMTGCVLVSPSGESESFHDVTKVTFLDLSEEIIERYLAEVQVLDKAGAYALQERDEWIIEKVEGSRTNVIGLPTEVLEKYLLRYRAAQA